MGCDIHLHIEVKLNEKWEHYGCPNINRDYRLFTKMAGVRNCTGITPIVQPKGLPEDLTAITQFDAKKWEGDAHDSSWLNKEEIVQLSDFLDELSAVEEKQSIGYDLEWDILHCYFFDNSFAGISKYPDEIPKGISDVRFVFWFDN